MCMERIHSTPSFFSLSRRLPSTYSLQAQKPHPCPVHALHLCAATAPRDAGGFRGDGHHLVLFMVMVKASRKYISCRIDSPLLGLSFMLPSTCRAVRWQSAAFSERHARAPRPPPSLPPPSTLHPLFRLPPSPARLVPSRGLWMYWQGSFTAWGV